MTWFNPGSRKILKNPPKIKRIDEGGFQVLGGIRFGSRFLFTGLENKAGKCYSVDIFGKRFSVYLWFQKVENKVIIFRDNREKKPPHNEIYFRFYDKLEIFIQPAYGGYLANDRP